MSYVDDLSVNGPPTERDSAIIDGALESFHGAKEPDASGIFEGPLTDLARGIAQRYRRSHEHQWLSELAKLTHATAMIEAENISAIADSLLSESQGLAALRRSRLFDLRSYTPEDSIYAPVDVSGARLIATANAYRMTLLGNPIFLGTLELLDEDRKTKDSFKFATGGGSQSHEITNGPCPPGRYTASGLRLRNDLGFTVGNVGYSINIDPCDGTQVFGRKYFRVHPDGWPIGTKGCIGIQGDEEEQRRSMNALKDMLDKSVVHSVLLAVRYTRD
ncbi:hypothetical protein L2Y96_19170 [Luteibacter aegosomaticola]|uniref:hypothetical protein n=1 Tax=Luteibacter aegosomaticola TaxID=2911538 RepID=UPI001FFB0667|nr:hypothetical protein [Luteibacter aegosomaticola]UPG89494.1 hypothetical protein L2Y96_19170 [Luteibacter aegosomaticola]